MDRLKLGHRDVTQFEFELDNVKCLVVECEFIENPCSTTDFIRYAQRAKE